MSKIIYLYPSRFWPGRFWIKTCGLTGDWGTMPIGEPQQWAFIPQGFEEYLPFRSEAAATEYAARLAQELAQRWGLALVESTYLCKTVGRKHQPTDVERAIQQLIIGGEVLAVDYSNPKGGQKTIVYALNRS